MRRGEQIPEAHAAGHGVTQVDRTIDSRLLTRATHGEGSRGGSARESRGTQQTADVGERDAIGIEATVHDPARGQSTADRDATGVSVLQHQGVE